MARVFNCSLCGAPSDKWGTGECLICGVDTISKKMSQFFGREDPSGRPPISKFSVVHNLHWLCGKRGPKRGDIARYRADDLTLCPRIDEMTRHGRMSVAEAMRRLSDLGLVTGEGTPRKSDRTSPEGI